MSLEYLIMLESKEVLKKITGAFLKDIGACQKDILKGLPLSKSRTV